MLIDEYFEELLKYTETYGEKTCLLMQVGSFYEMYQVKNEKEHIGNTDVIASLLNIQLTKKDKGNGSIDRKNPYMAGIPLSSLKAKYLDVLLDEGFTVIIMNQKEDKKTRFVEHVYSPSIRPVDQLCTETILVSIVIDTYVTYHACSICILDVSNNSFECYEDMSEGAIDRIHEEIVRILHRYSIQEYVFTIITHDEPVKSLQKDSIMQYYELYDKSTHIRHYKRSSKECKEKSKIDYQNAFLRQIYSHIPFGMIDPIDYFNLERAQLIPFNILTTIEFITQHEPLYQKYLQVPVWIQEVKFMTLQLDTIRQLSILPSSSNPHKFNSLYSVINYTKTHVGKRELKRLLCKPFKNAKDIQTRYDFSESIVDKADIAMYISEMVDIEKYHRKMGLNAIAVFDIQGLYHTYQKCVGLYDYLHSFSENRIHACLLEEKHYDALQCYIRRIQDLFDFKKVEENSIHCFRQGHYPELDALEMNLNGHQAQLEHIRKEYENLLDKQSTSSSSIKIQCSMQEGYYLECSKTRAKILQEKLQRKIQVKTNSSTCKITSKDIQSLSTNILRDTEQLMRSVKQQYEEAITSLYQCFHTLFEPLRQWVALVDIAHSNTICKKKYKYCVPIVKEGDSFFDAKAIRHPIIERIQTDVPYVPNDIAMNANKQGMILYALNSGGKSSLLRSVGLCLVMAQCGLYVPCSSFEYAPYDHLMTQVDMVDNLWKSQSSFVSEMMGLKKILSFADARTMVLSDELTKGTEVVSATSIFTATILELVQRHSSFIFTTHLHRVAQLPEIADNSNIQICHLSVSIKDDNIVFERTLQPGACTSLYGLEVASAVGLSKSFMDTTFAIRNQLVTTEKTGFTSKRSTYNTKKLVIECEICKYKPYKPTDMPIDTHHIRFQKEAGEDCYIDTFHKNSAFNLVALCKECHTKVHQDKIRIEGYKKSTRKGTILDYMVRS